MCEKSANVHFESACARFAAAHVISEVARATGMRDNVLRNKLSPSQPHQLTAAELIAIYRATGDDSLFDGMLLECGLTAVQVKAADDPRPVAQRALDTTAAVAGVTARAVQTLDSRRRITRPTKNALIGGLMAGVEQLILLATEVEARYQAGAAISITADLAGKAQIL